MGIFDIWLEPPAEVTALGSSLRRLIGHMLTLNTAPEELGAELTRLRDHVDAVDAQVAPHAREDQVPRHRYDAETETRPYYVKAALIGEHNPIAPLYEIDHADGVTFGTVRFGVAYEGPPGHVHGGFVAFFFDQVLGHHNMLLEIPAMTGTLTVRYRGPTPVLTDLRFEVRTAKRSERKVVNEAWVGRDDQRLAEAQGVFILPKPKNFMGEMEKVLPRSF